MGHPTLKRFIDNSKIHDFPASSYVSQRGMRTLYVRIGPRYLADVDTWYWMLDIANITASRPGRGAFSELFLWIRENHPSLGIFVENVMTDRFANALVNKFGFSRDETNMGCYYFVTIETQVQQMRRLLHGQDQSSTQAGKVGTVVVLSSPRSTLNRTS